MAWLLFQKLKGQCLAIDSFVFYIDFLDSLIIQNIKEIVILRCRIHHLSPLMAVFLFKMMLKEKTVNEELGESRP